MPQRQTVIEIPSALVDAAKSLGPIGLNPGVNQNILTNDNWLSSTPGAPLSPVEIPPELIGMSNQFAGRNSALLVDSSIDNGVGHLIWRMADNTLVEQTGTFDGNGVLQVITQTETYFNSSAVVTNGPSSQTKSLRHTFTGSVT